MKERIQNSINKIKNMASVSNVDMAPMAPTKLQRSDDTLSQSIRNEKEAIQFNAELKAAITLGKTR
jgi:rubrerythrin